MSPSQVGGHLDRYTAGRLSRYNSFGNNSHFPALSHSWYSLSSLFSFINFMSETQLTRVSEHLISKNERLISFTVGATKLSYRVQRNKHIDANVPVLVSRNKVITDWTPETKNQVSTIRSHHKRLELKETQK